MKFVGIKNLVLYFPSNYQLYFNYGFPLITFNSWQITAPFFAHKESSCFQKNSL